MSSLRAQLLVGVTLGTTAVLVVSGALLNALITRTLWAEFDESLAAKARSLAALAEQNEEGFDFELPESSMPEFLDADQAEFYQIWGSDGTVLARSPSLRSGELEPLGSVNGLPAFRSTQLPDGRAGRIVSLTFVPRQEYDSGDADSPMTATLVLGRGVSGLEDTLARLRTVLIAVGAAAIASAAALLSWIVRRTLKPIKQLTQQISDVAEDALATRLDGAGIPTELLPVVDRLNDLLARLDAAFQRERRFTGDVAHELRTPLAGLRSKLEVALLRERTGDAYRKTMDDCLRINWQMQRMVENLLHLARADAGQLIIRRELVDLPELVRDCWQPLEARAEVRGLGVEWRLPALATVETDREMLQLVIHNVLDNAVAYANDGGHVSVSSRGENGAVALTISNTGSTVPCDHIQQVFDRFWRGDSSFRQSGEPHCGLGLPLCKAVLEQLGGSIAACSAESVFTITIHLPQQCRSK